MYDLLLGNRNFDVMRVLDGFGGAGLSSRHLSDRSRPQDRQILALFAEHERVFALAGGGG